MKLQVRKIFRRQSRLFGCLSLLSGMFTSLIITLLMLNSANSEASSTRASFTPVVGSIDKTSIAILPPTIDQTTHQIAPDFTLISLDDGLVSLSDFRGQAVLINFWASWCAPCRDEMPAIRATYEAHKGEGFVVLGINMTYQDNRKNAEAFAEEYGISFPVLLDETGEVTESYGVLGVPTSVFINTDGMIVNTYIGAMTKQQLDTFIQDLIGGST